MKAAAEDAGPRRALSFEHVVEAVAPETARLLERVVETAARRGTRVDLVGGPVRDLLLDRALDDVDLRVHEDAAGLAEAVCRGRAADGLRMEAHDRFGTVRIESADAHLDLATLRHETYAAPGALPRVEAGSLEQDARRRDFAVNALALPLVAEATSAPQTILDPEGGLEDLAAKRLRILHPRSFHDDPTRAFRAARFAARLGFRLDRGSRAALRSALRDGAFGAVSGERYRRELEFAFAEARHGAHAGTILKALADWHVLGALEPGLGLDADRRVPLRRLSKTIAAPEWSGPRWKPWQAGLAIWLAPLPAALRRRALERFAVRGEAARRIVDFGRSGDRTLKSLTRARGRGAVDALLSGLPEETVQALHAAAAAPVRRRILRWAAEDRRRRVPVTGADLVEAGLEGAEVGRALERIRSGFLDGEIANREEGLALGLEIARRASRRNRRPTRRKTRSGVASPQPITDTPVSDDGGSSGSTD